MDISAGIKRILATGKAEFGTNTTLDSIRNGKAKAVIIANNTPAEIRQDIEQYAKIAEIPVITYRGTSVILS